MSVTEPLAELARAAAGCHGCRLAETRTKVVFGVGCPSARLVLVGEAPGRDEDLAGEPFVGRSGQLLDRLVSEELGLDRSELYIANVVKCRPPGNRDPSEDEVAACRHFLNSQVEAIDPEVIVTLGNFATRTILGRAEGITRLRGRIYEVAGRAVIPTYHPAAALRGGATVVNQMRADLVRAKQVLCRGVPSGDRR